jgi:hypothetical protein
MAPRSGAESSASSSSCRRIAAALVLIVLHAFVLAPAVARAQGDDPADALFDDSVIHDIRLMISLRDWESLKEHFQDNTRYPANLQWRDVTVRSIAIRSRGTGSRNGTKPAL